MSLFKKFIAIGSLLIIFGGIALAITVSIMGPELWWWIIIPLICLYCLNIVFAVYVFYSKRRNSIEKKCWMMVLIVWPILGVIAFLKYGFNPFNKTNFNDQVLCRSKLNEINCIQNLKIESDSDFLSSLSKYCINVTESYPSNGDVRIINNIEDLYSSTINEIRKAKKIIFINFYIIRDGIWLKSIANELKIKSENGVKIYFLFDWGGSNKRYPKQLVNELRNFGIKINIFRPKKLFYISSYDNSRSHKKIIIIDNHLCLYGGFNLADEYLNYSNEYEYWNDDAFIIRGNIVQEYIKSFICDWLIYSDNNNSKQALFDDIKQFELFKLDDSHKNNAIIQLYDSNPEIVEYQMLNFLILCLGKAKKRIWINTPYLYPTEYLSNVLIAMSHAGVDIRIIVPGLPDNKKFIISLNRSQYYILRKAEIKIYEINAFNHSKGIIIDDDISLIGTCNLDPRAMNLNYENISIVKSREFNQQLSAKFLDNIDHSRAVDVDEWKEVSFKNKILVKLLLLLEPLF